jgi:hypothetical protein
LTEHQRRIFVAVVVDGIPLDALTAKLGPGEAVPWDQHQHQDRDGDGRCMG